MTVDEFKQQFNDALTEATQIKDEMGSVKTLLDGLVEQINTLQNQVLDLQGQIANGGGDTQALVDSLAENMGALKESLDDTNQVAGQILAGTNADPGQPVVASVAKRKAAKTGTKPDVKTSTSKS